MKFPKKRSTDVYIRYYTMKFRRFALFIQDMDKKLHKLFYGEEPK